MAVFVAICWEKARRDCRETWAKMPKDAQSAIELARMYPPADRALEVAQAGGLNDDMNMLEHLAYSAGWAQQAGKILAEVVDAYAERDLGRLRTIGAV